MQPSEDSIRLRLACTLLPGLVAGLPLVLLLTFGAPAQPLDAARGALLAACGGVYNSGACLCAADAAAADGAAGERRQTVAAAAPAVARRVESSRVPIAMTPDFVRLVQACMAGPGAPAD